MTQKPSERIKEIIKGQTFDDLWENPVQAILQYLDEEYRTSEWTYIL